MFILQDGILLPHADYVGGNDSTLRINIALQTGIDCPHSEEDSVFHMRPLEIWMLSSRHAHSAGVLGVTERISLCLDFATTESDAHGLLKRLEVTTSTKPCMIECSEVTSQLERSLESLGSLVDDSNFNDILAILTKLHFRSQITARGVYDWLRRIGALPGNMSLSKRAVKIERYCLE